MILTNFLKRLESSAKFAHVLTLGRTVDKIDRPDRTHRPVPNRNSKPPERVFRRRCCQTTTKKTKTFS